MTDNEDLKLEFVFSNRITDKLKNKHSVTKQEVRQCFAESPTTLVKEKREKHRTTPPTFWFLAETKEYRELKVFFVFVQPNIVFIKTAFEPNQKDRNTFYKETKK